jgi:hypothetical protein
MTELHENPRVPAGLSPWPSGSFCTFAIKTRQQGPDVTSPERFFWKGGNERNLNSFGPMA